MVQEFVRANTESVLETLRELCKIPAPSHMEDERAAYCEAWLLKNGAEGVYIDEAKNVIFPINCEGKSEITVFVAHTDTVFPDTEPLPYEEDAENIYCPGAGDDTACLSVLLHMAKYFIEKKIQPKKGVLFVCNSCEEGLGNLKGTRQIFKDFKGRIAQFISLDGRLGRIADACAGSHRYKVEVRTVGGHSYGNFGNANAIHRLSEIIAEIYKIRVPEMEGEKTTYNVGGISGGTSVNTIAQSAEMLCEYRSSHKDCLAEMQAEFERIFKAAASDEAEIIIEKIGDRPCSDIDDSKIEVLRRIIAPISEDIMGKAPIYVPSSTDCNIPLSMGIPAICVGAYEGGGAHTREEWVKKDSLSKGLEFAIRISEKLTEAIK